LNNIDLKIPVFGFLKFQLLYQSLFL
jgi:hypothetical protein